MNELAKKLKEYRDKKGLTQSDVAEILKINRVTYTGYETGKHEPSLNMLIKIAEIFETSTDHLLGRYK